MIETGKHLQTTISVKAKNSESGYVRTENSHKSWKVTEEKKVEIKYLSFVLRQTLMLSFCCCCLSFSIPHEVGFLASLILFHFVAVQQAFEFYNKALRCLAERKKNPQVWDTVTWELSGSYFTMATLLQDHAPLSSNAQEQVTFRSSSISHTYGRRRGSFPSNNAR